MAVNSFEKNWCLPQTHIHNRRAGFRRNALIAKVLAKEGKMMHPAMILFTVVVTAVFFFGLYLAKTGKG